MPNDTATEKPGSAENRDNTITRGRHGSSLTLTAGRDGHQGDQTSDRSCSPDKIVLMQSLDFLGAQRDGCVAPAEADIGMMAFGFSQITHVSNKVERFLEIAKAEGS